MLDSVAAGFASRTLGERTAAWARWFLDLGTVRYAYGRGPGGYVTEGRLCQDYATDCVLFMCRVTELARSGSAREAVQFAFGTRFYGASVAGAMLEDGRVNYDDPAHLEYSEEMIRSGIWGADVTAECGAALRDTVGSSRVAARHAAVPAGRRGSSTTGCRTATSSGSSGTRTSPGRWRRARPAR